MEEVFCIVSQIEKIVLGHSSTVTVCLSSWRKFGKDVSSTRGVNVYVHVCTRTEGRGGMGSDKRSYPKLSSQRWGKGGLGPKYRSLRFLLDSRKRKLSLLSLESISLCVDSTSRTPETLSRDPGRTFRTWLSEGNYPLSLRRWTVRPCLPWDPEDTEKGDDDPGREHDPRVASLGVEGETHTPFPPSVHTPKTPPLLDRQDLNKDLDGRRLTQELLILCKKFRHPLHSPTFWPLRKRWRRDDKNLGTSRSGTVGLRPTWTLSLGQSPDRDGEKTGTVNQTKVVF